MSFLISGRCFKCGEEGHKKDECPTKDEVMDERKTEKQSGKYGKSNMKKMENSPFSGLHFYSNTNSERFFLVNSES